MKRLTIDWPLPEQADSLPELEISAHGTTLTAMPCRLTMDEGTQLATPAALSIASGSCDEVVVVDVLEFVRDDEDFVKELARILRPGGTLRLRTVKRGPLGAFDSANLYRYLHDMSKRGRRPNELAESGWRRHYDPVELARILSDNGVSIVAYQTSGLGLTELADFTAMVGGRWVLRNERAYLKMRGGLNRLRSYEQRLPVPRAGFWIEVVGYRE